MQAYARNAAELRLSSEALSLVQLLDLILPLNHPVLDLLRPGLASNGCQDATDGKHHAFREAFAWKAFSVTPACALTRASFLNADMAAEQHTFLPQLVAPPQLPFGHEVRTAGIRLLLVGAQLLNMLLSPSCYVTPCLSLKLLQLQLGCGILLLLH